VNVNEETEMKIRRRARQVAILALMAGVVLIRQAAAQTSAADGEAATMPGMNGSASMGSMGLHMKLTPLRPVEPGDEERAAAVAAAARAAIEPYQDYHKALADGYRIFAPRLPQKIYHFTMRRYGQEARLQFDASKPTSLLYEKTADGGFKLVGAMYTDRFGASEDELNSRIPLSVARWHEHVDICLAPKASGLGPYLGEHPEFGGNGSIATEQACNSARGKFLPHVFGWMVHVYPFESDPKQVWALDRDHDHPM
jgi:hypothetical protein